MLLSLAVPVAVAAVALFFISFLSWMVLHLHISDWKKMPNEAELMDGLRSMNVPPGNYNFPAADNPKHMQSPEFQKKYLDGPRGFLSLLPVTNMGRNLALTFLYYLVMAYAIAYLATIAIKPGAEFLDVFRFGFTAGFLIFFAAMIPQAIWFRVRIIGHLIQSLLEAAALGAIFAAMWPK
jgi:hypothetical protein